MGYGGGPNNVKMLTPPHEKMGHFKGADNRR